MKKRLLAIALVGTMLFSMTACGEKKEDEADSSIPKFVLSEENLDEYITLKDDFDVYDLEIDKIDISEDQVSTEINNLLLDVTATSENLQKLVTRPVEDGDTVNIDYVGTKDGVAFEGGTSVGGTYLEIGSNTYIDGFEDGLIGQIVGEEIVLPLTFPENYSNTELAGQAVEFTVTVHYIVPTLDDITDENVPDIYEGNETIEDLRNAVRADIYDSIYSQSVEYAVLEVMESKCTYGETIPQYLIDTSYNNIMENLGTYAGYYGMDLETYVYLCYYEELEAFQTGTAMEMAEANAKTLLYCQAYANEKDLNVTEEELTKELTAYAEYYGYASVDEGFTEADKDSIKNSLMTLKVMEYIVDNANVTEVEVEDTVDETVTE